MITAVEWLVNQVEDFIGLIPVDIIEKAKAMEREQMFSYTKQRQVIGENSMKFFTEDFEQYYKETYDNSNTNTHTTAKSNAR